MYETVRTAVALALSVCFVRAASPAVYAAAPERTGLWYELRHNGSVIAETPAGELAAYKLAKLRSGADEPLTEVGLARDEHHFPIRLLRVERGGTRIDQLLVRVRSK